MSEIPRDLKYTKEHEWVRIDSDNVGIVGITDFAQDQLGDIVYISLPEIGSDLTQSQKMGEVESVKSVSDVFSPMSGEVLEINQNAIDTPEIVNDSPYETGWLIKIRLADAGELTSLLSPEEYDRHLIAEEH